MINNDVLKTEVTNLSDGWVRLDHEDGYTIYLKTFQVEDKPVTVYFDGWSVSPIALYSFDLKDVVIDSEWSFVQENDIFRHDDMWDIELLQNKVPVDVYSEIVRKHKEFFVN